MRRYSAAQFRERLAEALNEAERGGPVVVDRRGVRYVLRVERLRPRRGTRRPAIEIVDPAVAEGQWTWTWTGEGLRFRPGPRRR